MTGKDGNRVRLASANNSGCDNFSSAEFMDLKVKLSKSNGPLLKNEIWHRPQIIMR